MRLIFLAGLVLLLPVGEVSANSPDWDRNPTDQEIQQYFETAVEVLKKEDWGGITIQVSGLEIIKMHAHNFYQQDLDRQAKVEFFTNYVFVKYTINLTYRPNTSGPPTRYGWNQLSYNSQTRQLQFRLNSGDVKAEERDRAFDSYVSQRNYAPGWREPTRFRSTPVTVGGQPPSKPPVSVPVATPGQPAPAKPPPTATASVAAACNASIEVPSNLRPGDDLSPSATVTSADGKPVQGIVQQIWYINGSQRTSVKWDGRETTILLQLSCQGHASEFRTTLPAYVEPSATPGQGIAGAEAVAWTGIAGTLRLPVPGVGGVGKIPGPVSLDQALVGILVPGLIGLAGALVSGLFGGGGGTAPPPAPPAPDAPPRPKRPKERGEQPQAPEKKFPTKEEIAQRHEKTLQEIARTNKEAAEANSWWGLFKGTGSNAGKEFKELGTSIKETVSSTARDLVQAGKDVKQDPSLILETLKGSAKTVAEGMKSAADMAASAGDALLAGASHAWSNPKDTLDRIRKGAKAIYDAVTDPKNLKEFLKTLTGFENFENSLDPNRSLVARMGQVGLGVMNLYGALTMGKAATNLIKSGGSKLLGREAATTAAGSSERVSAEMAVKKAAGKEGVNSGELLAPRGGKTLVQAGSEAAVSTEGIPKSQLTKMQKLAKESGYDIGIRPPAKEAGAMMESRMAAPKPPIVHNKSIGELDELIGAPKGKRGMVGHFEPQLPPKGTVPKGMGQKVLDRFNERRAEFVKYNEYLKGLEKKGFRTIDGVIHDVRSGVPKPLVSDVDLAGIFKNGKPIPEDEARMLISKIMKECPGVTHPDVNSWYATGQEAQDIMQGTIGKHLPGGTPLTVLRPDGKITGGFLK